MVLKRMEAPAPGPVDWKNSLRNTLRCRIAWDGVTFVAFRWIAEECPGADVLMRSEGGKSGVVVGTHTDPGLRFLLRLAGRTTVPHEGSKAKGHDRGRARFKLE